MFNTRRVGHTGTLDPFASGLLIVLLGRATRLASYLANFPKQYTGSITLGVTTETDDCTGARTAASDAWRSLTDDEITRTAIALTGTYLQQPPAYSAKKVAGTRAHRLARRGESVPLQPREVEVMRFDVHGRDGPRFSFAVEVSSGTYVRALARDLGERFGCGAHLSTLRRTRVGPFSVGEAIAVEQLEEARAHLRAPRDAVRHLPAVELDEDLRGRVAHGQPVSHPGTDREPIALVAGGVLVAVAERRGDLLKPRVVLEG